MKTFSTSSIGTKTVQITDAAGNTKVTTTTVTAGSESVQGGTIRHGDRHNALPWSYRTSKSLNLNGSVQKSSAGSYRNDTGVLASSTGMTSAMIESAIGTANDKALTDCINELYSGLRGNTNLGSSVGEGYRERIKNRSRDAARIADEARKNAEYAAIARARGRKHVRVTRRSDDRMSSYDIAKAWLAAKYKWLPVLDDIYSVAREATGTMTRKGFDIQCSGRGECGFESSNVTISAITFRNVRPDGKANVDCKGRFRFLVNPTLDQAARLTSLDPLVIAWDLIPYSFVVDWFYDVGGYLRDLETKGMYNSASKGGFITTRTRVNGSISHSGTSSDGTWTGTFRSSVEYKRCSRAVYSSLPNPNKPSFNIGLGSGTLLNAAALLRVKLKP